MAAKKKSTSPQKQDDIRDNKGRFKPGQSGNANRGASKKPLRSEIEKRLEQKNPQDPDKRKNVTLVVDTLFEIALDGSDPKLQLEAIREIFDRTEGKPVAAHELSGPDGGPMQFNAGEKLALGISTIAKRRRKSRGDSDSNG